MVKALKSGLHKPVPDIVVVTPIFYTVYATRVSEAVSLNAAVQTRETRKAQSKKIKIKITYHIPQV